MCTFCHAPRNDFEAFGLFVDFQKLGDGVDRDASICRADGAIACWSVLKSLGLLGGWGVRGREEAMQSGARDCSGWADGSYGRAEGGYGDEHDDDFLEADDYFDDYFDYYFEIDV